MGDHPALDGEPVTGRHARICREQGHAAHTVDGKPSATCPRCGDVLTAAQPDTDLVALAAQAKSEATVKLRMLADMLAVIAAALAVHGEVRAAEHVAIAADELAAAVDDLGRR